MSRGRLILISILAALALVAAWFFLPALLERFLPSVPPVVIEPVPEPETPDEEPHASLNLFIHSPLPLVGIARMELTLVGIEAVYADGRTTSVFEGARRFTLQQDIIQKIASDPLHEGDLDRIVLTFGPTARITASDRSIQTVYLPKRTLAVPMDMTIPTGRSVNALLALPKNTSFGEEGGVLTLQLPASTDAETYLLGGLFLNARSVGEVYAIPGATLREAILADIGLDIAPRSGERGSPGFGSPDADQPVPEGR